MGIMNRFLLIVGILCVDATGIAQEPVRVSDPRLELLDNIMHISYDILNSSPDDHFVVSLQVTDAHGGKIYASAFSGDIGRNVRGGMDKLIRWDLGADHLFMNEKIFIEIFVVASLPQENAVNQSSGYSVLPGRENLSGYSGSASSDRKDLSTTGLLLQSLVIPGLGLSRLTGKPHWIRGVAGYGCIAGSIAMNRKSYLTYQGIGEREDFDGKFDQLQASIQQDNISEILAYAAIGIWVTDFIWTVAGISSYHKRSLQGQSRAISITPGLDPLTLAPVVGIRYNF